MKISQNSPERLLRTIEIKKCYKNLDNSENKNILKKLVDLSMKSGDFRYLNAALKIYDYLEAKNDANELVGIKNQALNYVRKMVIKQ